MTENEYKTEILCLRGKLLTIARSYLGDATLQAEDVVQDVFIRLWQMRGRVTTPAGPLATVMVRNLCIDQLRMRQRESEACALADFSADSRAQMMDKVLDSVGSLPPTLQTVFRLRHIEGKEISEIASATESTEQAVRKALSRARMAIRDNFTRKGGING